jgi:hypothetical protein
MNVFGHYDVANPREFMAVADFSKNIHK